MITEMYPIIKIPLKEFWKEGQNSVVRCESEAEARQLFRALDKLGYRWRSGNRYRYKDPIPTGVWSGETCTCYANEGTFGHIRGYEEDEVEWTVVRFEDIDLTSTSNMQFFEFIHSPSEKEGGITT